MSGPHRIVALVEARHLAAARVQLHELGLEAGDLRIEHGTGPQASSDGGAPDPPVRRGLLLIARTAGALPGALAGVAIAIGAGLAVVPAAVLIALGGVVGSLAVTGRPERGPRPSRARVIDLRDPGDRIRITARCRPGQAHRVQQLLRDAGATLLELSSPAAAEDTPSEGAGGARP